MMPLPPLPQVVVHCWGGGGRAGRLLAAHLVGGVAARGKLARANPVEKSSRPGCWLFR